MARVAQGEEKPVLCFLLGQAQEGDFALISAARLGESGWRYSVGLGTWVTYGEEKQTSPRVHLITAGRKHACSLGLKDSEEPREPAGSNRSGEQRSRPDQGWEFGGWSEKQTFQQHMAPSPGGGWSSIGRKSAWCVNPDACQGRAGGLSEVEPPLLDCTKKPSPSEGQSASRDREGQRHNSH